MGDGTTGAYYYWNQEKHHVTWSIPPEFHLEAMEFTCVGIPLAQINPVHLPSASAPEATEIVEPTASPRLFQDDEEQSGATSAVQITFLLFTDGVNCVLERSSWLSGPHEVTRRDFEGLREGPPEWGLTMAMTSLSQNGESVYI